jgi:hypothetical protein
MSKTFKLSDVPEETQEIALTGLYDGIVIKGNVSIPLGIAEQMQTGEMPLVIAGLCEVVKGWNLTDDDGNILPVDEDTIRRIPGKLIKAMTEATVAAMNADVSTP